MRSQIGYLVRQNFNQFFSFKPLLGPILTTKASRAIHQPLFYILYQGRNSQLTQVLLNPCSGITTLSLSHWHNPEIPQLQNCLLSSCKSARNAPGADLLRICVPGLCVLEVSRYFYGVTFREKFKPKCQQQMSKTGFRNKIIFEILNAIFWRLEIPDWRH